MKFMMLWKRLVSTTEQIKYSPVPVRVKTGRKESNMVDYYRINVSRNGVYLFATEDGEGGGGIVSVKHAEKVLELFKQKFPESEGYRVTCIYWEARGHVLNEVELVR